MKLIHENSRRLWNPSTFVNGCTCWIKI